MLRKILIVGGGTAGWLCACYLAKTLHARAPGAIQIDLVESPDIGILGVGEGTFPSIRGTLSAIGIREPKFLRASNATFKQGIKFAHWVRPPGVPGRDHYLHPFNQPSNKGDGLDLVPYWLLGGAGAQASFAEAVTMQKHVTDAGRGPKRRVDADYQGPMNYAYHFDASRFAAMLAEEGRTLGVRHHLANVEHVELDPDGAISAVVTRERGALSADLYIDCSGHRAVLISGALGESMHKVDDVLFADRAVAMQVPYAHDRVSIPSYTISTAHEAGWTWDIGLQQRRGIGYVYSSRHSSDERAEQVLRRYIGAAAEGIDARLLKFDAGYRPVQWKRNCVAVGLSSGFLEPLESTGIGLIEIATYLIAHLLPFDGDMASAARHFNENMATRYRRIIDFIKMHYCLSQRRDSDFWIDNVDPRSVPDTLREKLAMWRHRPPHRLDFVTDLEMFLPASWQFVLYGMEYVTDLQPLSPMYPRMDEARQAFETLRRVAQHAINDLPPHRELIDTILLESVGRSNAA